MVAPTEATKIKSTYFSLGPQNIKMYECESFESECQPKIWQTFNGIIDM